MIYFDNAATTLHKPDCVKESVYESFSYIGNSGRGAHSAMLNSARKIFEARTFLSKLFEIDSPENIAFTSNATEALNIAIKGLISKDDHVITSVCEHNSVLRPLYETTDDISFIPIKDGNKAILDYSKLDNLIKKNTKAIIITHASNLTGNITDLDIISSFAKKHNLLLIVDASQTAGAYPISIKKYNIDVLCFTGHKSLYGPQGTGGLYVNPNIEIKPLKVGGSGIYSYDKKQPKYMPTLLEAGTLNGHGIVGLASGINWILETGLSKIREKEMMLHNHFYKGIKDIPGIIIYGDLNLNNKVAICSINLKNYDSSYVADKLLEDYNICVRAGAHCAPLIHEALNTKISGAIRFSFSYFNTLEEIEIAINALKTISLGE